MTRRHINPDPGLVVPPRPPIPKPPTTNPPGTSTNPPPPKATRRTVKDPREALVPRSAAGLFKTIVLGGPKLVGPKVIYARSFLLDGTPVDLGAGGGGVAEVVWMICHVAEPPVNSIRPWLDGVPMSGSGPSYTGRSGKVSVWTFPAGTQVAADIEATGLDGFDADAAAEEAHTGEDALAVIKVVYHATQCPNLPDFQFEVEGYADVLDTRDDSRGYLTNTAACIREFITNTTWGMKDASVAADSLWDPELDYCDGAAFLSPPGAPAPITAGADLSGDVSGATYWYAYTLLNSYGAETIPGARQSINSSGAGWSGDTGSHNVTVPVGAAGTTARRLYRGLANMGEFTQKYLVAEIPDNTTTLVVDTLNDSALILNAKPPTRQPKTERYSIAIALEEQSTAQDWLDTLRAHCMGALLQTNGKWRLDVDRAVDGSYVKEKFADAAGAGGLTLGNVDLESIESWRKDRDQLPNQVTVWITDAEDGYKRKPVTIPRPGIPAGQERTAVFELPGITEISMGARLATLALNLFWNDLYVKFRTGRGAIGREPRDVISAWLAGLTGQDFRIEQIEQGADESVTITALEYQPAAYAEVVLPVDSPNEWSGGD